MENVPDVTLRLLPLTVAVAVSEYVPCTPIFKVLKRAWPALLVSAVRVPPSEPDETLMVTATFAWSSDVPLALTSCTTTVVMVALTAAPTGGVEKTRCGGAAAVMLNVLDEPSVEFEADTESV